MNRISSTPKRPRTPLVALRGKNLIVKHQSLSHDKVRRKAADLKNQDIAEAVEWCRENGKRGWAAVHSGLFPLVKHFSTIDNRLDGIIEHGNERSYSSILTSEEERSLIQHLKNKSRCLQGLNQTEVSDLVIKILKTRKVTNRKSGRRCVALSDNANNALSRGRVSRSFFSRLRSKYPDLPLKTPKKVDINRGFNVTRTMAENYLDDLAEEINHLGIGDLTKVTQISQVSQVP